MDPYPTMREVEERERRAEADYLSAFGGGQGREARSVASLGEGLLELGMCIGLGILAGAVVHCVLSAARWLFGI